MGGLRRKMPITAFTMLVGVLAIAGTPLFSGWYSKDVILANAMGFGAAPHAAHRCCSSCRCVTAGMTAFYMFRLWFLTFAGEPRDQHVHEHAHESPWVMTVPLIVLAVFSVGVAWGWPLWDPDASYLGHLLRDEPHGRAMAHGLALEDTTHSAGGLGPGSRPRSASGWRSLMYGGRKIDPAAVQAKAGAAVRLPPRQVVLRRAVRRRCSSGPTVASRIRRGPVRQAVRPDGTGRGRPTGRSTCRSLDGVLNAARPGHAVARPAGSATAQTGLIRAVRAGADAGRRRPGGCPGGRVRRRIETSLADLNESSPT